MKIKERSVLKEIVRTSQPGNGPQIDCVSESEQHKHPANLTIRFGQYGGGEYEFYYCSRHLKEELAKEPTILAEVLVWMLDSTLPFSWGKKR